MNCPNCNCLIEHAEGEKRTICLKCEVEKLREERANYRIVLISILNGIGNPLSSWERTEIARSIADVLEEHKQKENP